MPRGLKPFDVRMLFAALKHRASTLSILLIPSLHVGGWFLGGHYIPGYGHAAGLVAPPTVRVFGFYRPKLLA